MSSYTQHLVIGGGPAGAVLGMRLAAAGREVLLIEKEREAHDKVCGEFLSREALAYLRQAGMEPRDLGAATIRRVRLTSGNRHVETRLPFKALSLSRRLMDEALLHKASISGCLVRRGASAERLERCGGGWRVRLRGGEEITAQTVYLATGKHDLGSMERRGGLHTDLVGFKMHWRLTEPQTEALQERMDLFLFHDGYGGLSLVENRIANLCFVVRKRRLRSLGGWNKVLEAICGELPSLREQLNGARARWAKPLAISAIPYGYIAQGDDGVWRVGDQAAVIPSFTGDGMSIALHSGVLAAEMSIAGSSAQEYTQRLGDQLRGGMRFASLLSRTMVTAWGRAIAPLVLSCAPSALRGIATATRIPNRALLGAVLSSDAAPL